MKRSSKILAALLTALLLVGVFATAIFASDLTTPSAKTPTLSFASTEKGVVNRHKANFEGKAGYYQSWDKTAANGVTLDTGVSPSFNVAGNNARRGGAFATVTKNNNTYGRVYFDGALGDTRVDSEPVVGETVTDENGNKTVNQTVTSTIYQNGRNPDGKTGGYFSLGLGGGTAGAGDADTTDIANDYSFLKNDFIVVDFDLAADMYRDAEGNLVDPATLPADADLSQYTLSYGSGVAFTYYNRNHYVNNSNCTLQTFKNSDGTWCIGFSASDSLPLSNEVGKWNHITYVWVIDNRVDYTYTDGDGQKTATSTYPEYLEFKAANSSATLTATHFGESKISIYINGALLGTKNAFPSTMSHSKCTACGTTAATTYSSNDLVFGNIAAYEIRLSVPDSYTSKKTTESKTETVENEDGTTTTTVTTYNVTTYTKNFDYLSYSVDNFASNFYKDGYSGELAETFANGNVPKMLGEVDDIVYNYNYSEPSPNAEYAAAVTSSDGEEYKTTYYYTVVEALANLGENDILALADGVAMNLAPEFPFYMIRNTEKTLVTYENGYSEIAVDGGFYVTNETVTADQLVAEGTGVRNLRHANFNEYLTKTMQYCNSNSTHGSVSGNNHGEILFFSNQLVTSKSHGVMQSGVDATGKNGYMRFWHDRTDDERYFHTGSSNNDTGFDIYYDTNATGYLLNHKYVVWNLDVMSDKYMTYNSATSEYTFTDEVTDMLAYGPAFRLGNVTSQFVGGSTSNLLNGDINFWFSYDSTAKQYYVKLGGTSEKIYLSKTAGEWNHLSMVFAIDNTVDCEDAEGNKIVCSYPEAKANGYKITSYHLYNSKLYAYANGQLVAEKVLFNTANVNTAGKEWYTYKATTYGPYNSSGTYVGTGTHVYDEETNTYKEATYGNYVYDEATETYNEVTTGGYVINTTKTVEQLSLYRQRISDGYAGADNWKKISYSVGFDNASLVYYDNTYAGTLDALYRDANGKPVAADGRTLASIVGKDVVGDSDYKYSVPNAAGATVNIGNEIFNVTKDYSFAEGALAEAFEGATVTVKSGNVKDFVPSTSFNVVYGADGVSVSLKSGIGFVAVPTDNGINIRKSNIKINWFGKDGKSYGASSIIAGTAPTDVPTAIDSYREEGNKFYYLNWSGKWLNGADGAIVEDFAALAEGEYNLYAEMIVPVIDIDESLILFNLTVANKFEKYVYVPYITGGDFLYNEVTYLLGGSKPNDKTLEGYASTVQDYPSAVAGANAGGMWINATINGYESRQWVRMPSVPEYIEKVLTGNFDYYTKKLCVNMARYCDEIYDYTREYRKANNITGTLDEVSPYNAYCTGDYAQYLIDTTTSAFNTQIAQDAKSENLNRIIDYFDGATFYLANTGIPRLAFVPKTLAEGTTLPKEIIGVYYAYNAFKGEDPYTVALPMDVTGNQSNSANTGIYMNVNRNERIYFYANDLKITVYFKDGSSETGTYNLASYIKGIEENGATATGTSVDVAKAMYAYSMAAIEYMTTEEGTAAPAN